MAKVDRRVRHADNGAPFDGFVYRWLRRLEHASKDFSLGRKEAAVYPEAYVTSDQDDVAVVEPEFRVARYFGVAAFRLLCVRPGAFPLRVFCGHGKGFTGSIRQDGDGGGSSSRRGSLTAHFIDAELRRIGSRRLYPIKPHSNQTLK